MKKYRIVDLILINIANVDKIVGNNKDEIKATATELTYLGLDFITRRSSFHLLWFKMF